MDDGWARRRKWLIGGGVGLVLILILGAILFFVLYKAPSCTDGKQNQGETGIDCGGPCPYLCSVSVTQPIVRFATAVSPQKERTDVIAYIDNPNSTGGVQNAQYTVQLYGANDTLLAQRSGIINLPPSTTAPLYLAKVYEGPKTVTQAFLTLDSSSLHWLKAYQKPVAVIPSDPQVLDANTSNPKVTATLSNPIAYPLYNVTVVGTVFGTNGNAIAASQTVVPELPPQGSEQIVFTWNEPFSAPVANIEILPATGS